LGARAQHALRRLNAWWLLPVFLISCHPAGGPLNYVRPYLAGLLVGATLVSPTAWQLRLLKHKGLVYIASISFALYVVHHLLMYTWLGEADTRVIKYVKRIPLFALTFALAHVSTFYFEHPCMDWGKRLSARLGWSGRPASPNTPR
jgi:peptidoglycan/LPS O-acetylase OafA/YrhL